VDPRAGLDDMEKVKFLTLLGLKRQLLGHPTHSQSPYRLRYRGRLNMDMHSRKGGRTVNY
jgi:hypothetical protein